MIFKTRKDLNIFLLSKATGTKKDRIIKILF